MAIQTINVGNAANDGTGDDLREAFIKINQNFQVLDSGITSGENLGSSGAEVFAGTVDNVLNFRRLVAGNNITLSQLDNTIVINSPVSDSRFVITGDSGSLIAGNGINLNIIGSNAITVGVDENTKTITITGSLAQETAPALGANLSANGNNITGAGSVTAASVFGVAVTGNTVTATNLLPTNINGVDYYDRLGRYVESFDFGEFNEQSYSILDWVIKRIGVDFGTFTAPTSGTVDLGNFV